MYLIKLSALNLAITLLALAFIGIVFLQINNPLFILGQSTQNVLDEDGLKEPSILTITTNPPTPGVQILIDGNPYISNNEGKIIFNSATVYQHRIEVPAVLSIEKQQQQQQQNSQSVNSSSKSPSPSSFLSFGRWEPFMPKNFTLTLDPGIQTNIELGVVKNTLVNFEFLDANSNLIDKSKIDRVLLISSSGKNSEITYPFKGFLEENFFAKRQYVSDSSNGNVMVISAPQIQSLPQKFKIMELSMDNVNVLDKSKNLEFYPKNTSTINLYSKVYPLKINLVDRIFGSPVNAGISLEIIGDINKNSNSSKQPPLHFKLVDGKLGISQLPKATYLIRTDKGIGFGGNAAVILTKPQEVKMEILTYKSAAIVGIISLVLLIIVILVVRKIIKYLNSRSAQKIDNEKL